MWPWPSQKRSKRFDLRFGFSVPVGRQLDLERSYLAGWQLDVRESPQSLLFSQPWSTFATATHLNNDLQPPSAYTAVVRLLTTPEFLVKLELHPLQKCGNLVSNVAGALSGNALLIAAYSSVTVNFDSALYTKHKKICLTQTSWKIYIRHM